MTQNLTRGGAAADLDYTHAVAEALSLTDRDPDLLVLLFRTDEPLDASGHYGHIREHVSIRLLETEARPSDFAQIIRCQGSIDFAQIIRCQGGISFVEGGHSPPRELWVRFSDARVTLVHRNTVMEDVRIASMDIATTGRTVNIPEDTPPLVSVAEPMDLSALVEPVRYETTQMWDISLHMVVAEAHQRAHGVSSGATASAQANRNPLSIGEALRHFEANVAEAWFSDCRDPDELPAAATLIVGIAERFTGQDQVLMEIMRELARYYGSPSLIRVARVYVDSWGSALDRWSSAQPRKTADPGPSPLNRGSRTLLLGED
jgi:hypothetical protein